MKINTRRKPIKKLNKILRRKIWINDGKKFKLKIMGIKQQIFLFLHKIRNKGLKRWSKGKLMRRLKRKLVRNLRMQGRRKILIKLEGFYKMNFKKRFYKKIVESIYKKHRIMNHTFFILLVKIKILNSIMRNLQNSLIKKI